MVTELSKRIKLSEESFDLTSYFPSLLWIIRDFHLELIDEYGLPITHDEYLENALKDTAGFSKDVMERNKIRSLLKTFFKERHCFTLVRPANSENDLQNLSTKSKTRIQFEQQIIDLRKLIFESLNAKSINGVAITGKVFLDLMKNIITSLNDGAVFLL